MENVCVAAGQVKMSEFSGPIAGRGKGQEAQEEELLPCSIQQGKAERAAKCTVSLGRSRTAHSSEAERPARRGGHRRPGLERRRSELGLQAVGWAV